MKGKDPKFVKAEFFYERLNKLCDRCTANCVAITQRDYRDHTVREFLGCVEALYYGEVRSFYATKEIPKWDKRFNSIAKKIINHEDIKKSCWELKKFYYDVRGVMTELGLTVPFDKPITEKEGLDTMKGK